MKNITSEFETESEIFETSMDDSDRNQVLDFIAVYLVRKLNIPYDSETVISVDDLMNMVDTGLAYRTSEKGIHFKILKSKLT